MTGSDRIDAERAFRRASRRGPVRALRRRLRGAGAQLPVYGPERGVGLRRGPQEVPVHAIVGTVEPVRATQFDPAFRPRGDARWRWERIWRAEHRGTPLPPVTLVPVEGGYAVQDGHHRVSVARARGAVAIDAIVVV